MVDIARITEINDEEKAKADKKAAKQAAKLSETANQEVAAFIRKVEDIENNVDKDHEQKLAEIRSIVNGTTKAPKSLGSSTDADPDVSKEIRTRLSVFADSAGLTVNETISKMLDVCHIPATDLSEDEIKARLVIAAGVIKGDEGYEVIEGKLALQTQYDALAEELEQERNARASDNAANDSENRRLRQQYYDLSVVYGPLNQVLLEQFTKEEYPYGIPAEVIQSLVDIVNSDLPFSDVVDAVKEIASKVTATRFMADKVIKVRVNELSDGTQKVLRRVQPSRPAPVEEPAPEDALIGGFDGEPVS